MENNRSLSLYGGGDKRKLDSAELQCRVSDVRTNTATESAPSNLASLSDLSRASNSSVLARLSWLTVRSCRSRVSGCPSKSLLAGTSSVASVSRPALLSNHSRSTGESLRSCEPDRTARTWMTTTTTISQLSLHSASYNKQSGTAALKD